MITAPAGQHLRVVTQTDHAHLAAELLRLWRRDGLPDHPRRRSLLFAVREHDNGWWEEDSAPRVNPLDGRPHHFRTLPREPRIELWQRGVRRFADRDPEGALLILRHAEELHRPERRDEAWAPLFETLDAVRQALEETLGDGAGIDGAAEPPPRLSAEAASDETEDYRFLNLADRLSLLVCLGEPGARLTPVDGLPYRAGLASSGEEADGRESAGSGDAPWTETLWIDPFPLAGATTLRLPCRLLPDRPYPSDTELGLALASQRWQSVAVRCVPRDSP